MTLNRSALYTTSVRILATFLLMVAGIFVTRLIGVRGRGIYAILLADVELLSLFFLGAVLPTGVVRFWGQGKIEDKVILGLAFWIALGTILLSILFLVTDFGGAGNVLFPSQTVSYKPYVIFLFVLAVVNALLMAFLQALNRIDILNAIVFFNAAATLVIYGTVFLFRNALAPYIGVKNILIVSVLLNSVGCVVLIYNYSKLVGIWPTLFFPVGRDVKPFFNFLVIAHSSVLINFFNYRLDLWILESYRGLDDVGIYSLAVSLAQVIWLIPSALCVVLLPYFVNASKEDVTRTLIFFSRVNFVTAVLLSLLGLACSGYIIPRLYGEAFTLSVVPFRILLFGIVAGSFTKIFAVYMAAKGRILHNLMATTIGLIFTVVLDLTLIPRFGIAGACIATCVSYLAIAVSLYYSAVVRLREPAENYFIPTIAELRQLARRVEVTVRDKVHAS
jgi:O-antigen/teichoic acid export membrane protein